MTIGEARAFARATETVAAMGELARQEWWTGWIAYLDHARGRMPGLLSPRRMVKWKWIVEHGKQPGQVIPFKVRKPARAQKASR